MSQPLVTLRHIAGNAFEDVKGGREPIFAQFKDGGQLVYMHQSGYGTLRAEDVAIEEPQ